MRSANVTDALGDFACDRRAAVLLYERGIEFDPLTSEQQSSLAATLAMFRAAQTGPGGLTMIPDEPRN